MIEAIRQAVGEVIYDRYGEGAHSAQTVFIAVKALKKLLDEEYGVADSNGDIVWFLDDEIVGADAEDSIKDAKAYLGTFGEGEAKLMRRLVTKGKEVKH